MAVEVYGVVIADIDTEFGDYPARSASTRPTSTQVTARITTVAGEVNEYLDQAGFTTAQVTADDDAQEWVKRSIVLGVSAWVARSLRGAAQTRSDSLLQQYQDRLSRLVNNPAILGTIYSAAGDSYGTRTHNVLYPASGRLAKFHYASTRDQIH